MKLKELFTKKLTPALAGKWFIVLLALGKSFFNAVTQVAWGIASLVILNASLLYMHEKYGTDLTYVTSTFLKLDAWVFNNIMFFFWIFFILYAYFEIRDVLK